MYPPIPRMNFAVLLQCIEAHIMLNLIYRKVLEKGNKAFNLHDSFLCKKSEAEKILDLCLKLAVEFGFGGHIKCKEAEAKADPPK